MPRILLADDHGLIRDALPSAIRRRVPRAQFECVGTAADTIAAVMRREWSLVVLDLGLPGGTELETLRHVRELRPALPILVFSMFPEAKMGVAAIEAGASGYLCKTADRATIGAAVAETLAGEGYRSVRLRELLAKRARERHGEAAALSRRELEVLIELGRGRSNKEIAAGLGVSVTSVGTYRTRIMEKLGLRTTADLLRYVVEHRLLRE
ncbi:MAG: response regulator transcription factor [Opitutae bacterium]|nr:response regulator transcription factor [Opitutae bacterium]